MSWEQRNTDFCNAQTNAQMAYIEAEREADKLQAENANLRERITTQKQTIQAYRDESREWREVAERAQAENAKLRELCENMYEMAYPEYPSAFEAAFADRMRELGMEVDA